MFTLQLGYKPLGILHRVTERQKVDISSHDALSEVGDAISRSTLLNPRSGDSQGQETFLAPSVDKQTRNYDTECSNHHPSLSTLRSKELRRSKMKW